jgi:hypothetical protein
LHTYKLISDQNPQGGNQTAGEPWNVPFKDGKVAISLMNKFTDSPFNAGSLAFAGKVLASTIWKENHL